MIEVVMNKDVRQNETKFIGPLSLRKTITLGLAVCVGVPIFMVLPFDLMTRFMIAFIIAMPIGLCGWVKPFGLPFEYFLVKMIYLNFLTPPKRKARPKNIYRELYTKISNKDEQKKLDKMTKGQRKKYLKQQSKPIKRSKKRAYKIYV